MGEPIDTRWIVFDLLTALGLLALCRSFDRDVSARHRAVGTLVDVAYRAIHDRFVGSFRRRPGRYLAFNAVWTAASAVALRDVDEADQFALGVGICLSSAVARAVGRRRRVDS